MSIQQITEERNYVPHFVIQYHGFQLRWQLTRYDVVIVVLTVEIPIEWPFSTFLSFSFPVFNQHKKFATS